MMKGGASKLPAAPMLPEFTREDVAHVLRFHERLPWVDWDLADRWLDRHAGNVDRALARRSVMALSLDELRDALKTDHRRWRSRHIEGVAPLEGPAGPLVAAAAERACETLQKVLAPVRGNEPIPPVAIIAIATLDEYIDFISARYPDEGEFATSGGMYINEGAGTFPMIVVSAVSPAACADVVAHELTHHALHDRNIPLCIEEGFTQMMEERVNGATRFDLNTEMIHRHRDHWHGAMLDEFIAGGAFHSPEQDTQELAYHLSQWIVRKELSTRSEAFFRFVQMCKDRTADEACRTALGVDLRTLVASTVGNDE
ncbi:MAG: hypothetical protein IBJ18_03390 [Phycisphaerales bacterium]|nr:hypothetical protein [Phycisphaerales bacterium]